MSGLNKDFFALRIKEYTPSTLPMNKLAEYLKDFSDLLGNPEHVHFKGLTKGSAVLKASVDDEYESAALTRLSTVNEFQEGDAGKAYTKLNERLLKDNASATLKFGKKNIVEFPGRKSKLKRRIGPVREHGQLEGELIRIGGKDESIHITLLSGSGESLKLTTGSKELAKEMAHHLFSTVRVEGLGVWYRSDKEGWELESLKISSYEVIEDCSLIDVVAELQAVEGSEWSELEDPLAMAAEIRRL